MELNPYIVVNFHNEESVQLNVTINLMQTILNGSPDVEPG